MSTSNASRSLPTAGPASLADLLERITSDPNLTPRTRQDRASAVRTLAKVLGKPPEATPAHPGQIAERLKSFTPAMAGLAPARLANMKSLVRAALKEAGLAHMPGRYTEPLSPAWEMLFTGLTDRMMRFGLSRFARYCTTKGIAPEQVADATLTAFLDEMRQGGLVKDPRKVHRSACLAWNKAVGAVAGWPSQAVTVPNYTRTYAVPWDDLPVSLRADVDRYLEHLQCRDPFRPKSFKGLRPASIATRRRQLHEYVSALIRRGYPTDALRTLADVVEPANMVDGLRFIMEHARNAPNNPGPDAGRVHAHSIATALAKLARHWVDQQPPTEARAKAQAERTRICRALQPEHRGLRDKNRARLRQFDDPDAIRRLAALPPRLLIMARRVKQPTRKEALQVQLAVMLEILMMLAPRLKNLAGLRIGHTILRARNGRWQIAIPGHEVKNGSDIETTLPAESGRLIDIYLESYRPLLNDGGSDWLFPGRKRAAAKSADAVHDQIVKGVAKHCGLTVNPHLFRHLCAKTYLQRHPGAYGVVRLVLGHKSMNTTIANYCGTESAQAFEHYDAVILKNRQEALAAPEPGGRKQKMSRMTGAAARVNPPIEGTGHGA